MLRPAEIGETAIGAVERQSRLDTIADAANRGIQALVDAGGPVGTRIKNFLHGTWLGHPLHPVLTDVPIGAWTAAAVMDVTDDGDRGAERAIAVGVAGAAGAALAGIADWHHTAGGARRVGLVHAMLNTAALTLYVSSLALRRRGNVRAGRGLAFLGYATVLASAYLGGALVYRERTGVDHAPHGGPDRFTPVLSDEELPEGALRRVKVEGTPVLLARRAGRVHALAETCSHMGGPLAEGQLVGDSVVCPWHGSRFALEDGHVLDGPAAMPQPRWEARVRNGRIEVRRGADATAIRGVGVRGSHDSSRDASPI
jgi:nitrite reductase/ring-hydroxylating ferredoxin subunit